MLHNNMFIIYLKNGEKMMYKNSDISALQTVASHFHHNQIPTFC